MISNLLSAEALFTDEVILRDQMETKLDYNEQLLHLTPSSRQVFARPFYLILCYG